MKRYEQAKADYEFLVEHHGEDCSDLTGGYVADDEYFELLRNPTKKNAYYHYCRLISHYASCGYEDGTSSKGSRPDFDNEEVCEVFRRNCDEEHILIAWDVDISETEQE